MSRGKAYSPPFPTRVVTSYHDGPWGRMRSRAVGQPAAGIPEIVLVQGFAVADYLLPGLAALGEWTRAHLIELPGLGGSGDPPHELTFPEYGDAVRDWLQARRMATAVVAGHSSGTQVAAEAASRWPQTAGLVLASPTVDPMARGLVRLFVRWQLDGREEPPGLTESHLPEWRRAGIRRLWHIARAQLDHAIEDPVAKTTAPVLVIRGARDRLSTSQWARSLASLPSDGGYVEVPGAHTFPWRDPHAWSEPIRSFTEQVASAPRESPTTECSATSPE